MSSLLPTPRGGAFIAFIVGITAFLTGGIGLLILDAITCDFNVVFSGGCGSSGGGGGGGGGASAGQVCTSAANSCGMTNTGFIVDATLDGASYLVCNADVPLESECTPPSIGANDFYADPATIGLNRSTVLHWSVEGIDSTECTITGSNGFTYTGTASGSVSSGNLAQTTEFVLSCRNGGGPASSMTIRVIVDPRYQEI